MTRVENLREVIDNLNRNGYRQADWQLMLLTDIALSLATIADTLKETREFFCGDAERRNDD